MLLISAIILLGILIFVHELGHFLFAKLMGVKVLRFSIGFGKKLVGRKYGETEYRISAFPLGGYVKMFGEEREEEAGAEEELGEAVTEEDLKRSFSRQPVWKRLLIVLAGPTFNLALGAVIFTVISMIGVPDLLPYVGGVREGSPAERAGIMMGDKILEINGVPVEGWIDIESALQENPSEPSELEVERDERVIRVTVAPERKTIENILGEEVDIWTVGIEPLRYPIVGTVMEGTPADGAGLRSGDLIMEIDGAEVQRWRDMTEFIHARPGEPLEFKIERDGETFTRTITPEKKKVKVSITEEREVGLIGISPQDAQRYEKFPPLKALENGVARTVQISALTLKTMVKVVQRLIPARDTLGGPITIVQMAGETAARGAMDFFMFMAVISIGLGIINLFPIPILDGGHVVFLAIEGIFRRPLSESVTAMAQRVGLVIILTLMAFVIYLDLLRVKDDMFDFLSGIINTITG
jgi:regulator of sigma E protease